MSQRTRSTPSGDHADMLSSLAPLLRVRPELHELCLFSADWAANHTPEEKGWAPFHIVTDGACLIDVPGREGVRLEAGDIAILPHGGPHAVRGVTTPAGASGMPRMRVHRVDGITIKSNADKAADTQLICGRLKFEQAHRNFVLATLPSLIVVRTSADVAASRLRLLTVAIKDELEARRPGAIAIAADLASALVVMVIRAHVDAASDESSRLLKLLGHRQTARPLAAMLEDPARAWTLDELAETAHTSRATLVRAFQKAVEMAPLGFLAELRLNLARNTLLAARTPIAEIASDIGYQSESAFNRAFKRHYGVSPGEFRRKNS